MCSSSMLLASILTAGSIFHVSRNLTKVLNINWKLHSTYRPFSRHVERINRTLKDTLTKLILEPGKSWAYLLPYAEFWVPCAPFAVIFGRPFPILPKLRDMPQAAMYNPSPLKSFSLCRKHVWALTKL